MKQEWLCDVGQALGGYIPSVQSAQGGKANVQHNTQAIEEAMHNDGFYLVSNVEKDSWTVKEYRMRHRIEGHGA